MMLDALAEFRPPVHLFTVDHAARSCSRHHHEGFEIALFDAEQHSVVVRGTSHPTTPRSLVVVAPGEVHATRSRGRQPMRAQLMVIEPETIAHRLGLDPRRVRPGAPRDLVHDASLARRFVALHRALLSDETSLERDEAELAFVVDLVARSGAVVVDEPLRRTIEPIALRRAREYLDATDDRRVDLTELSQAVGLTRYHLVRTFTRAFGVPPHLYHVQARLRRARALLDEGRSIAEVAVRTGFNDQSHLHRHFRRWVGVTPGEYVKSRRN